MQDVWFRSLSVERGMLLIENERGERFEIDPATRHVLNHPATAVGTQIQHRSGLERTPHPFA